MVLSIGTGSLSNYVDPAQPFSNKEINVCNIAIKHGFSCVNICQVQWEVLKTKAEGRGFQHLPRDLVNVNALKNPVRSLFLH